MQVTIDKNVAKEEENKIRISVSVDIHVYSCDLLTRDGDFQGE